MRGRARERAYARIHSALENRMQTSIKTRSMQQREATKRRNRCNHYMSTGYRILWEAQSNRKQRIRGRVHAGAIQQKQVMPSHILNECLRHQTYLILGYGFFPVWYVPDVLFFHKRYVPHTQHQYIRNLTYTRLKHSAITPKLVSVFHKWYVPFPGRERDTQTKRLNSIKNPRKLFTFFSSTLHVRTPELLQTQAKTRIYSVAKKPVDRPFKA